MKVRMRSGHQVFCDPSFFMDDAKCIIVKRDCTPIGPVQTERPKPLGLFKRNDRQREVLRTDVKTMRTDAELLGPTGLCLVE